MGGRKRKTKRRGGSRSATADRWHSLTWEDLRSWAGSRSVSRGRTYQRQGAVSDLAVSPEGVLLASVRGTRRYVTSVWWGRGKQPARPLESRCSCPVGFTGCKHAIAVVAAYLQAVADEAEVPEADPDDPRWDTLEAGAEEALDKDWDAVEEEEGEDWAAEEEVEAEITAPRSAKSRRRADKVSDKQIREDIAGRSHEQLVELLMTLINRFPELREEFRERILLTEGDADRLVREARREIREITAEPGWRNPWEGEGYCPDYSRLKRRLRRLVELDHADAVMRLGPELIERGMEQVEQSHDEGETAMALSECLDVVFEAVARSTQSGPKKLLFAIDACMRDEFDVVGEAGDRVLNAGHAADDWSIVADELKKRLKRAPKGEEFHDRYRRDRLSNWLGMALEHAGREDELSAIYEDEARRTQSYERLVRFLLDRKRYDEAEQWAQEGIEQTREKWSGIAWKLAELMAEQARRRRRWEVVAAHAAWRFLELPSHQRFEELLKAAGKAGCREEVRRHALRFLETGKPPVRMKTTPKRGQHLSKARDWPLPVPEFIVPLMRETTEDRPRYDVLLEKAIAEKRSDDALHWYDQLAANGRKRSWAWGSAGAGYADRVAEAVAESHPERALAIYEERLEANLKPADPSAYEACASYLRKMRPILKRLGREDEWKQRVAQIREDYRRRLRFMEILDELDGQSIVRSQRSRRRKR